MNESNLTQRARQKLIDLGYKSSDIYSEYPYKDRYRMDIVVFYEETPYVVIEVKNIEAFSNNMDYKFDPTVRQAQTYANNIKAPFFSVFDGKEFYWFTTDSDGRPKLINELIAPLSNNNIKTNEEVKKSLLDFRNYALHSLKFWAPDPLLILVYVQILDEMGYPTLKKDFLNGSSDEFELLYSFDNSSYYEKENLQELFYKLERIKYVDLNPEELLLILDEVFFSSRNSLFVPRWLSDLMVKLGDLKSGNNYLDFFSINGNFIAPIILNNPTIENHTLKVIYANNKSEYWFKIQELLLKSDELIHIRVNPSEFKPIKEPVDRIFIAPEFGVSNNHFSEYTGEILHDNLEILIEKAIKQLDKQGLFVSIIPDSFLYANKYKNIRNLLKTNGSILSLISLPNETFKPYAHTKTSIIVYEKGNSKQDLFIGKISEIPKRDTFNSGIIPSIKFIYENFVYWLYEENNYENNYNNNYLVSNLEVDYNNLSSLYNLHSEELNLNNSNYNLLRLTSICKEIKKGSNVKVDKNGKIPFINPGSIRELFIDENKLGLTSLSLFENNYPRVRKGDIVINSISTYRGAAALINENMDGLLVNNQVIILRPDTDKVLPEYLNVIFNSRYIQNQIKMISSGIVISFIPLNLLREIMIPVPPITVQKSLINAIEFAKEKVIEAENIYRKANIELADLLKNFNIEEKKL